MFGVVDVLTAFLFELIYEENYLLDMQLNTFLLPEAQIQKIFTSLCHSDYIHFTF